MLIRQMRRAAFVAGFNGVDYGIVMLTGGLHTLFHLGIGGIVKRDADPRVVNQQSIEAGAQVFIRCHVPRDVVKQIVG